MQIIRQHFNKINSTNTWAKQNAAQFPRDQMTLVTADSQTAGRGRFNREWVSPEKQNIYASFCFFEKELSPRIGNIPQIMAISVAKVLESFSLHPTLKWPNDILIAGKKVGGVLTETVSFDDGLCLIVGVGINVNMPQDLLKNIDRPATSLLMETGHPIAINEVLDRLQRQFVSNLHLFFEEGFDSFLEYYQHHFFITSGQPIRFHDGATILEGEFQMLHHDGSLSLRLSNGTLKRCIAGEIL